MTERTKGPWEYVPGTEHHGPYVVAPWGGDVCDCYTMSNPAAASVRNGGTSYPINFQGESADANAAFIVEACNSHDALIAENKKLREALERIERGGISVLLDAALSDAPDGFDECPINPQVLQQIVDDCRSALDYIQMHSNEKAIREKAASALSQTGVGR